MIELVMIQVKSIKIAIGNDSEIKYLYIDGKFSDNDIFIESLSHHFRSQKLRPTNSS